MNRKGFMMAEVVVVSAVVMLAITGLYTSYGKIYSIYNTRVNYYDTNTLYRLAYYRDYLIENTNSDETKLINYYIGLVTSNKIISISDSEKGNIVSSDKNENVYLIYKPNDNLKSDNFTNINLTFKDYINFLSASETFEVNYLMIMEACDKVNKDDCKYAYLEVYEEN